MNTPDLNEIDAAVALTPFFPSRRSSARNVH
jgi:hypothetical protein